VFCVWHANETNRNGRTIQRHPSRVFILLSSPAAKGSGRLTDSVIMTDNLATALDKAIVSRLGQLADMKPVDAALRSTLGL
jgi:mRNA interferase MazF